MPNNFKIIPGTGSGFLYLSNSGGNDANSGESPDLAKSTFAMTSFVDTVIVGSGQYKGALSVNANDCYLDGLSRLVLTDNMPFRTNPSLDFNKDSKALLLIDGAGFELEFSYPGTSRTYTLNSVVLKNLNFDSFGVAGQASVQLKHSVVNNGSLVQNVSDLRLSYDGCVILTDIFVESVSLFSYRVKNSFLGSGYYIDYGTTIPDFNNCCINGIIRHNGIDYDLKQDKDGNPVNGGSGLADVATVYPSVYTNGNFSQDAEYYNIAKGDFFNVAPTSPLLRGADDGGNIANAKLASRLVFATDPEFASPTQSQDIITSLGDLIYDTGAVSGFGTITSQPIEIAPISQELGANYFASAYNFDVNEVIGSAENLNVLAETVYAGGTAGRNPQRLSYEMRWAIQNTQPASDGEWDNQGYVTAGDFSVFEVNSKPTVDNQGLGNADPNFIVNNQVPILARWVQFRITINEGA